MNAIKNTIVTITLIAVGYGAYVVLQNPATDSLGENEIWNGATDEFGLNNQVVDAADSNSRDLLNNLSPPTGNDTGEFANASPEPAFNSPAPDLEEPSPYEAATEFVPEPHVADNAAVDTLAAPGNFDDLDRGNTASSTQTDESFYDRAHDTTSQLTSTEPRTNDVQTFDGPAPHDGGYANEPAPETSFGQDWAKADTLLQQERLGESLLTLSKYYGDPALDSRENNQLMSLLDQLAGSVIYSHKSFLEPSYEVQDGESLNDIANRYQIPVEFLSRINGLEPNYRPISGEMLKVLRGPFTAQVDLAINEMTLFLGEYYAGRFRVRVGQKLPQADAIYEVIEKSAGREFFDSRTGYRVPKNDPSNPYGKQWIGLRGDQVTAAHNIGIHVANENVADGAIGVTEVDATDLATILSIGSKVIVRR